jgi:insulysin
VVPAKESHKLSIVFPTLRPFAREWKNKSNDYICNVLGHEGKNSLLSYLVSRGFATGLMATDLSRCRGSYGELTIAITLTKLGAEYHQDIIKIVFESIKKFASLEIQDYFY